MENQEPLKESRVNWHVSGDVECPHCEHGNDFTTVDEWFIVCDIAQNIEKFSYPCEMECEKCKKMFNVVGSDY